MIDMPLPRRPPASSTRNAPFAVPSAARIRSSTSSPMAAIPTIQAAVIITPISQENDDSTKCPQTGDSSNHIGWLAALYVSGGVLTLLGVSGKKRKKSEVK
mgnify:CR=1 FL=1